jgi:hypothetical protein
VVPPAVAPLVVPVLAPVVVSTPLVIKVDSLKCFDPLAPAPLSMICPAELFKLPLIADTKAYLNLSSILQYYLHRPKFSTQCSDDALITDSRNAKASSYWEGQIRVAVQEGSLCLLFESKGLLYNGKGFEMLAVLNQHCHPDLVANAFMTLMSNFNDNMSKSEDIMAFQLRFNGMLNEMSRCKIFIPPMLMVMSFLRLLHSCYETILNQFWLH